ncbi:MAG: thioredoxin family protein [Bacteroidota bacterium]
MSLSLKKLWLLFAITGICLLSGFHSGPTSAVWQQDFQSAMTMSEESGHPVLMVFSGSDWCRPCMKLKEQVLESSDFYQFAENHLVLLEVDFPRSKKNQPSKEQQLHNEKLAERFNPQGIFPYVLLLNSHEEVMSASSVESFQVNEFIALVESWVGDN